ncbi:hypothetical protein CDV36_005831 [Fusarium kuroshium]|uniref:Uncharacterized protein n=4 Tax=Fusarium solani species complex TaxID=232080 RepID=A0A3M2SA90_9HYPO|nr:hypothetical protein CDV36_005831 [Fusarium kuroshium]RSM08397.1 hypothetical protein CEP52_004688 [Fusarium oligoseptatum]
MVSHPVKPTGGHPWVAWPGLAKERHGHASKQFDGQRSPVDVAENGATGPPPPVTIPLSSEPGIGPLHRLGRFVLRLVHRHLEMTLEALWLRFEAHEACSCRGLCSVITGRKLD